MYIIWLLIVVTGQRFPILIDTANHVSGSHYTTLQLATTVCD